MKITRAIALLLLIQALSLSCNSPLGEGGNSWDLVSPVKVDFPLAVGNQWVYQNFRVWMDNETDHLDTAIEYDTLSIAYSVGSGAGRSWVFRTRPASWMMDWNTLTVRNDSVFGSVTGFAFEKQSTHKNSRIRPGTGSDCTLPYLAYISLPRHDTVQFTNCSLWHKLGFRMSGKFSTPIGDFNDCLVFCYPLEPIPSGYSESRSVSSGSDWGPSAPDGYGPPDIIKPGIGVVGFENFNSLYDDTLPGNVQLIEVHLRLQSYSLHQ